MTKITYRRQSLFELIVWHYDVARAYLGQGVDGGNLNENVLYRHTYLNT